MPPASSIIELQMNSHNFAKKLVDYLTKEKHTLSIKELMSSFYYES